MKCPECGYQQDDGQLACGMCGVIFAKLHRASRQRQSFADDDFGPARPATFAASMPDRNDYGPTVNHLDRATLMYGGIGLAFAVLTLLMTLPFFRNMGAMGFLVNIPNLALGGLSTLVHEMGHSFFGWIFGYPSIPAFDLRYGGGVAMELKDRSTPILVMIYMAFAYGFWHFRRNPLALIALGVFVVGYSVVAFTGLRELLMIFMGHGTELVFAALALYRGFSGKCVAHELERLAYAVVGWFLVLHNLLFAGGLIVSEQARFWYGQAKGGGHWMDFDRIARNHLGVSLQLVALFFFCCCLMAPVIAFLAHRYQTRVYTFIDALTES